MSITFLEAACIASATYTERSSEGHWRCVEEYSERGFAAKLWLSSESESAVLGIRGTATPWDALQDLRLLIGREPRSWRKGRAALQRARERCGAGGSVLLTGHSLGGAFAALLAEDQGLPAVTFNAPGIRHVSRARGSEAPIWNVCVRQDWIRHLSGPGPGVTLELDIGGGDPLPPRSGLTGLGSALRQGSRAEGGLLRFLRRAVRMHRMGTIRMGLEEGTPVRSTGTRMGSIPPLPGPHVVSDLRASS